MAKREVWVIEVKRGKSRYEPEKMYDGKTYAENTCRNDNAWAKRSGSGWKFRLTRYIPAEEAGKHGKR
jgi:hypothetical protein